MIKIWNRPKVEFGDKIAYCMGVEIAFIRETEHLYHASISAYGMYSYQKSGANMQLHWDKNKTFEQAVNEWVESYVKQTFEPIVLVDGLIIDQADLGSLLSDNPNIIIEEVQ